MKFLTRRFAHAPEGTAALFFIQIFATLGFAVLYSTLVLYATEASASWRETGHHVDGCLRRIQLWPAPVRRIPGRPLPRTGICLSAAWRCRCSVRMHRDRHTSAVLHRPRTFSNGQWPQRHLHQHDAHAALYPGGSASGRRISVELRRHERRLLRRIQRRRPFPGHRELREPLHLRYGRQLRRHHPRLLQLENADRPQYVAARRDAEAVPAAPARWHRYSHRSRPRCVVHAPTARRNRDDHQGNLRRGSAHSNLPHGAPTRIGASSAT